MPDPAAPLITVPLPTIDSRTDYYERAVAAYKRFANVEIITFNNLDTCGQAWARGAAQAQGDYIHFGADDVEMLEGWWQAATQTIDQNLLPAPLVYNPDGTVQSCGGSWGGTEPEGALAGFTRGPFVSRAQWELLGPLIAPFLEQAQYWTDNIFSWAGRKHGIETVVCRGYQYIHHLAEPGRGAGMEWEDRMRHDHALFDDYTRSS